MPNYTIEARSLGVVGVASHDFWVLRDENGGAIDELHGLATDRETNIPQPVGTDEAKHSLRIWHFPHDPAYANRIGAHATELTYIDSGQMHMTILDAHKDEILARWGAALVARESLNALDLSYPNLGFNLFSDTVNSNSAYRTLGEIMGVAVKDFPGVVEPGIDNRMTTPKHIDGMRTHGYPVLDVPSIREGGMYKNLPDKAELMDPARVNHPDHTLYRQALSGVHRLDAEAGRTPDDLSRQFATSLTLLAKQSRMQAIDHVMLGEVNQTSQKRENVFIVRGALDDPAHDRAIMQVDAAVETSLGASLGRLQVLNEVQSRLAQQTDLQHALIDQPERPLHRSI